MSEVQLDLLAQLPLKANAVAGPTMSVRIINSGSIEGRPISAQRVGQRVAPLIRSST
jgi:hypothetical protein